MNGLSPHQDRCSEYDRELPAGGEGGLWFIQQVARDLTDKAVDQQGEKGLSCDCFVQEALQ